jgi:hypothetical protein
MAVDDTVELSEKVPSDDDGDGVDEMMIGEGAIELAETDSATEEDGAMDDKITDDTAVEGSTMLELGAGVETKLALAELDENTADELIADEAAEVDKTGKAARGYWLSITFTEAGLASSSAVILGRAAVSPLTTAVSKRRTATSLPLG